MPGALTRLALVLLGVSLGLARPVPVQAHTASESFSRWEYSGQTLTMRFTIRAREASRIAAGTSGEPLESRLAGYLAGRIRADSPRSACSRLAQPQPVASQTGYLQVEMTWNCEQPPQYVEVTAFFDLAAEHMHFASMQSQQRLEQRLLTAESPRWVFASKDPAHGGSMAGRSVFGAFLNLGFRHVLGGPDHVVFLLGLLLLCRRFSDLAWAVSGFTLGHSITLSLAALGLAQPNVAGIEAAIGLTIALVAVERTANLQNAAMPLAWGSAAAILLLIPLSLVREASIGAGGLLGLALFTFCYLLLSKDLGDKGGFRVLITSLFGLIHGFGFAGAFQAASLGQGSLLPPLAGFNLGIELGQLALVAVLFAMRRAFRNRQSMAAGTADWVTAVVCGLGVFWFMQRMFAGSGLA